MALLPFLTLGTVDMVLNPKPFEIYHDKKWHTAIVYRHNAYLWPANYITSISITKDIDVKDNKNIRDSDEIVKEVKYNNCIKDSNGVKDNNGVKDSNCVKDIRINNTKPIILAYQYMMKIKDELVSEIETHIPLKQWDWKTICDYFLRERDCLIVNLYHLFFNKFQISFEDIINEYNYYHAIDEKLSNRVVRVIDRILSEEENNLEKMARILYDNNICIASHESIFYKQDYMFYKSFDYDMPNLRSSEFNFKNAINLGMKSISRFNSQYNPNSGAIKQSRSHWESNNINGRREYMEAIMEKYVYHILDRTSNTTIQRLIECGFSPAIIIDSIADVRNIESVTRIRDLTLDITTWIDKFKQAKIIIEISLFCLPRVIGDIVCSYIVWYRNIDLDDTSKMILSRLEETNNKKYKFDR